MAHLAQMQVISFSPCPLTPPSFEASALVRAATFYLFTKPTTCIGHERWSLNAKTSAEISLIHNFASQSAIWGMQGLNVLIYCLPRRADEKKAGRGCNQEESKIQNPSRRNLGKDIYCIPLKQAALFFPSICINLEIRCLQHVRQYLLNTTLVCDGD